MDQAAKCNFNPNFPLSNFALTQIWGVPPWEAPAWGVPACEVPACDAPAVRLQAGVDQAAKFNSNFDFRFANIALTQI